MQSDNNITLNTLRLVYNYVGKTEDSRLYLYNDKYNWVEGQHGLIDHLGNVIIPCNRLDVWNMSIFSDNKTTILQYIDSCEYTLIYRVEQRANGEFELVNILKIKGVKFLRFANGLLVLGNILNGGECIVDTEGRAIFSTTFLHIVEHLPSHDLLCVRFLHVGADGYIAPTTVDILNRAGKIKQTDVIWGKEQVDKYHVSSSTLRTRNLEQLKVKKEKGKYHVWANQVYRPGFTRWGV